MNMLSSLKALLFSTAAPGTVTAQPAAPDDTADFAALFSGSMTQEAGVPSPLLPIAGPAITAAAPELPRVDAQDAAASTPDLPLNIDQPPAAPAQGHVPHGLAIAVAVGKSLPPSLPPGHALGLTKQAASAPLAGQSKVEPAELLAQPEPTLPNEAPVKPEAGLPNEAITKPESGPLKQVAEPVQMPKSRPTAPKGDAIPDPLTSVAEEIPPVQTKSPAKEKARTERPEQDAALAPPSPQPLVGAMVVPPVIPEPLTPVPADSAAPEIAASNVAAVMTVAVPSAVPPSPVPVPREPEPVAPDRQTVRSDITLSSATPQAPGEATETETRTPELTVPAAPIPQGKPVKAEALALLQMVREQFAGRETSVSVRVGEQLAAVPHAKADAPARPIDTAFDPSTLPLLADAAPVAPVASAPQTTGSSVPAAAPVAPSPDLSASLGAQVVDMGVSGQWIDGLARDIAGLSANGAQGRFQIDTRHLGTVQVDIRHDTDGAAVSLTVASEAAEVALRQDSDRLKLDAGLAAVRIAEVKVERAPAIAEAHRAETSGQSSSQQLQQPQQGSQASAWAQNGGQNMGQPQGQQNRWQGRENSGFGPKGSGDPAVLNHADAPPAAHDRARARYA